MATSPPAIWEQHCTTGEDFVRSFVIEDEDYSTAGGTTWLMEIRRSPGAALVKQLTHSAGITAVLASGDTTVTMTIADTDTDGFTPGDYRWSIRSTKSGINEYWFTGDFHIHWGVIE